MRLVIVSGLSGTGKTVALKLYEDLGYYCIDNIPLDLALPLIAHAVSHPDPRYSMLVLPLPSLEPGPGAAGVTYLFAGAAHKRVQVNVLWRTGDQPAGADRLLVQHLVQQDLHASLKRERTRQ